MMIARLYTDTKVEYRDSSANPDHIKFRSPIKIMVSSASGGQDLF